MTGQSLPVFAIFEGGGAKGLAHLGAAIAMYDNEIEMVGVAGSSAGAFVAALLAGGYRGADLYDPMAPTNNILTRYGLTPLELLGTAEWSHSIELRSRALATGLRVLKFGAFATKVFRRADREIIETFERIGRLNGYFSTEKVRDFINARLREKLVDLFADKGKSASAVPDRVTFADLDTATFPQLRPLKIVATDIGRGCHVLFSRGTTPCAEIGEAVAASIAIPFVFKPVTMTSYKGGPFVDGGLVSNLPTWVFVEEKLSYERRRPAEPPVAILAFSLMPDVDTTVEQGLQVPGFVQYAIAVATSAVFGGQSIPNMFVEDVVSIPLATDLDTMQFDAGPTLIREAVEKGRIDAKRSINRDLRLRPRRIAEILRSIVEEGRSRIDDMRQMHGLDPIGRMRAAVIGRWGNTALRVLHSVGMDDDADDRLMLDPEGPGTARVFRERAICYVPVQKVGSGAVLFSGVSMMTKYETASLWAGMRFMICIPIYDQDQWTLTPADRADCSHALCLDSDTNLGQGISLDSLNEWFVDTSVTLQACLEKEG